MVLSGAINKEIVGWIAGAGRQGDRHFGQGRRARHRAKRSPAPTKDPDSQIERRSTSASSASRRRSTPTILDTASAAGIIPVVAPIAAGRGRATYNINADTMAGAIAAALGAARLFLLTDVAGVLDKQGDLLTDLTPADIAAAARPTARSAAG